MRTYANQYLYNPPTFLSQIFAICAQIFFMFPLDLVIVDNIMFVFLDE